MKTAEESKLITPKQLADNLCILGMINENDKKDLAQILTTWKEDICKKQREICADVAEVFLPSHPALHRTANINREEILNAPEPT